MWWLPFLLVALWWFVSASSTSFFFPPLSRILEVTIRDITSGILLMHLMASLGNMVMGLAFAIIIGVASGLVIGETRPLREASGPFLNFVRAIPPAAIVPIVIVAMGTGPAPKIFIIAFACVWPIMLNTIDGVRGMNPQLMETARAFRIPFWLRNRRVLVMAALPQIMAGIRIALAVALVLMVIGEFVGASKGLGFYIREKKESFAMAEAWGGTILTGILGYLLSAAFLHFERWTLAWHFQGGDDATSSS
ncbi:MAG: ABC transporter permease [Hoeflea sp.]|nr:MAG: ABC transporter permease [Hoeflea sp.]